MRAFLSYQHGKATFGMGVTCSQIKLCRNAGTQSWVHGYPIICIKDEGKRSNAGTHSSCGSIVGYERRLWVQSHRKTPKRAGNPKEAVTRKTSSPGKNWRHLGRATNPKRKAQTPKKKREV